MNDFTNAYIQCNKSLKLLISIWGHDTLPVVLCYDLLSDICLQAKKKAEALEMLQKARSILVKLNNTESIEIIDKKIEETKQSID